MKKYIIILIVFLLIVSGFLLFFLFGNNRKDEGSGFFGVFFGSGSNLPLGDDRTDTNNNGLTSSTTPALLEDHTLSQLTVFPALGELSGSRVVYYRRNLGHRYLIDINGENETRISNFTIPAVASLDLSNYGNSAILFSLENDSAPSFFSLEHQGTSTIALLLPISTREAAISPEGDRVAILEETSAGIQIILTTPELRSPKIIYKNDLRDFSLSWVSDELLLLTSRPSALRKSISILVNINGNSSTLLGSMTALDINFAKNGTDFLYSFLDDDVLTLRASTRSSDISTPIPVRTFAEKCVWSSEKIIYCAVPRSTDTTDIVLPDDWLRGEISFSDVLWKINIETGDIGFVADMQGFDIVNLSGNEDYLVFNNKNDSTLWSLQLFENEIPSVEVPETVEGESTTDN